MNEYVDSREEKIETVMNMLSPPIPLEKCMDPQYCEGRAGVPLLCTDEQIFVDREDSHTIIFGSTGSKKHG